MQLSQASLDEASIAANGIHLHVVQAGPPDGCPILLLHGFPDFWYSYRLQIPVLARAGYRVIVPDQRGYHLSDKSGPFDVLTLCQDIASLQDSLEISKSYLIGHDWGGGVAWTFAALFPERVERLVILNAPHLQALRDTYRRHPIQLLKSLYILYFQLPWLPEWSLRARNFKLLAQTYAAIHPRHVTPEDIELYRQAWSRPGALSAMLGWYRAILRSRETPWLLSLPPMIVPHPTLVIWGEKDPYLDRTCNENSSSLCPKPARPIPPRQQSLAHDRPTQRSKLPHPEAPQRLKHYLATGQFVIGLDRNPKLGFSS